MTEPTEGGLKPTMYCQKCWYVLDGLTEPRCPECGRPFDPARRRSYRTKPRGRWWLNVVLGTAAALLVLFALSWGWFYWRYTSEQRIVVKLEAAGIRVVVAPVGPAWLRRHRPPDARRPRPAYAPRR